MVQTEGEDKNFQLGPKTSQRHLVAGGEDHVKKPQGRILIHFRITIGNIYMYTKLFISDCYEAGESRKFIKTIYGITIL